MPRIKMTLPEDEVSRLNELPLPLLRLRVRELFNAGWSYGALSDALVPRRSRSTLQSWCASSAATSTKIVAAESLHLRERTHSAPLPPHTHAHAPGRPVRALPFDPEKSTPRLSEATRNAIREMAPSARRHRAGTRTDSVTAIANAELTRIFKEEYLNGVSIRELASAADVTYKAVEKRVKSRL